MAHLSGRSPGGGMITWKSEATTLSFRDSLVRTPLDTTISLLYSRG